MSFVAYSTYRNAFININYAENRTATDTQDVVLKNQKFIDTLKKEFIIFFEALKEYFSTYHFNIVQQREKFDEKINSESFETVKKISKIVTQIYSGYKSCLLELPRYLPTKKELKLNVQKASFYENLGQGYKTGSHIHFSDINNYIAPIYDAQIGSAHVFFSNIEGYVVFTQDGIYLLNSKFEGGGCPIIDNNEIDNFIRLHSYL